MLMSICLIINYDLDFPHFWSAFATTPASTSAGAGAKEAINFTETYLPPPPLSPTTQYKTWNQKKKRRRTSLLRFYFSVKLLILPGILRLRVVIDFKYLQV
jgi:hypothetical protein